MLVFNWGFAKIQQPNAALLGGSWDLVSKAISTLIGVITIVTRMVTLVTKSHDRLSTPDSIGYRILVS